MDDERYVKVEIKKSISKTELKKLLKNDEVIPGAYILEKNSLQIK